MSAGARHTFRVPAFVAAHGSPLVKQAVLFAKLSFANRDDLRSEKRDRWGNLLYGKLHLFLFRSAPRPKLRKDGKPYESPEQLAGRRADHFQLVLSFWLTLIALADHETWELREPKHERAKQSPYPSLARIAEFAEMDCSPATVERIRKEMQNAGVIAHTHQFRAPREDGKGFFSAGGGFRRLGAKVLASVGGFLGRAVMDCITEAKEAKEERKKKEKKFNDAVDELFVEKEKLASALEQTRTAGEPAPLPLPPPDPALQAKMEEVHEEHGGWLYPQVLREAKRRLAAIGAALAPKPNTS